MASGILIVDKPEDWTSQDVVAKLRGALHERRAGHGGTLDPMATGVLPVFFGRATRAVEFFEHAEKTYETVLRLGLVTDTQDITGRVLEQRDAASVTEADVRAVLPRFLGPQKQVPPMYSAIKIGGKKLYELARAGQEVARPARDITIHALELLSCAPPDFTLRVHCSKGTYVRTLCHDLGAALGTGGCMAALRRTAAGADRPGVPLAVCGPSCTDADARAGEVLPQRRFVHAPLHPRPLSPVCRKRRIPRPRRGPGRAHGDREELFCDLRGCI